MISGICLLLYSLFYFTEFHLIILDTLLQYCFLLTFFLIFLLYFMIIVIINHLFLHKHLI